MTIRLKQFQTMISPDLPTHPLVSVVLCTYNGERFIEQQIQSVLNQTYKNIEVIVLDDASSDATTKLLNQYLTDVRIQLIRNSSTLGLNENFSKGVSLAKGEFVAFCDQDDIWKPEKLEKLVGAIGQNDLIYHDSVFIDEDGNPSGKTVGSLHNFVKEDCSVKLIYQNCVSGHALLARADFLKRILPVPDGIYYDWYITFCAACRKSIAYTSEAFVFYRIHPNAYTKQHPDTSIHQRIRIIKILKEASQKHNKKTFEVVAKLEACYHKKLEGYSWPLFRFLLQHYRSLFYIRKRSIWSKIKYCLKEAFQNVGNN